MSIKKYARLQTSGRTDESDAKPTTEDPIPEFDRYGDYTGYDYFRYAGCGIEMMQALQGVKFDSIKERIQLFAALWYQIRPQIHD